METTTSQQAVPLSSASAGNSEVPVHDAQAELKLWKAIAPCWQRAADTSTLPVTLRVSFDVAGGIASPPEIERKPGAAISLRSESQALQALAACAPYRVARNQQDVGVYFPMLGGGTNSSLR